MKKGAIVVSNKAANNPLVSIVVAVYKSELFLDKLITSIREQTYNNLDVILVDDGSPDDSGLICDKYAAIDSRIRVLHKENGGTCDARNKGVALARGEYLSIIDGDDWLAPDYVEYLLRLVQRPGVDMAMTDSVFTTRDLSQNPHDNVRILTPEEAVAFILYVKTPIGPWNKIYRLSSIKEHGLTFCTTWSGEGLYYSTMAAMWSKGVAVGHRRVYYYRLNNAHSGLTDFNVQMGINAYENINYIKQCLEIRTPATMNAADWHIWRNYFYLLYLIVATHSEEKYSERFCCCKRSLRRLLPRALFNSDLSMKTKIGMLIRGLLPVTAARALLIQEAVARKKDQYS